ncbi:MAG: hypothetical protein E7600_02735 [Ruminococcaceae bacterium]|nr:hypothetical protein [Oscillospiraceae bacterium]
MMKDTEFAFAVAKIRSNEYKLLTSNTIEALISAQNYNECIKILSEAGYEGFDKNDEDTVLSERQRTAFELIYSSAPDKHCLDFLIVKNDFHNFKAILKSKVTGADFTKLVVSPSCILPGTVSKAVDEKDYSVIDGEFGAVLKEAYGILTETMDGQMLEVFLDRKCLEMSVKLAEESKDDFAATLANLMCALTNIRIALRCIKTGKDTSFVMNALADSSIVDKKQLAECCAVGIDELAEYVKRIGYNSVAHAMTLGYAAFEKQCDDILIEKIRFAKYQNLGIAPLIAYYFATDAEIKTVRIILSCKKNGIDTEIIRERVRELYV